MPIIGWYIGVSLFLTEAFVSCWLLLFFLYDAKQKESFNFIAFNTCLIP